VDWGGHVHSTLLEVAPEIDTNPTSLYRGVGGSLRLQTPALAMSVHSTYFDLATPLGDVSHKPGGRLTLLSARPAVTLATFKRAATNFAAW